jgi:hypothetical protein
MTGILQCHNFQHGHGNTHGNADGLSRRDETLLEESLNGNKMITTGIVRHITDDDTLNQMPNGYYISKTDDAEHKQNTDCQLLTASTQTQPPLLSPSSAETPTLALYNTGWVSAQKHDPDIALIDNAGETASSRPALNEIKRLSPAKKTFGVSEIG